jgi:broad specificity phosphatase PhoE
LLLSKDLIQVKKTHLSKAMKPVSPMAGAVALIVSFLAVLSGALVVDAGAGAVYLRANESEVLAIASLQSASLTNIKQVFDQVVTKSLQFHMLPGLFQQQNQVYPEDGQLQLPSFGATKPWEDIVDLVSNNSSRRLVIMVRHGQAWENLNPDGNDKCNFTRNGETINNFDSTLSTDGITQSQQLQTLFKSYTNNGKSWFDRIGLSSASYYTSPVMRAIKTRDIVFGGLTKSTIQVSDMMRASIGTDACNYRHSVHTPTSLGELPAPWNTGCVLPDTSLTTIFNNSQVNFDFTIRPQGGPGFGLLSDSDTLWRSDVVDDTHVLRARVFLAQIFEQPNPIVCVITHGEMMDALYKAAGLAAGYEPVNTEVVPMVVESLLN